MHLPLGKTLRVRALKRCKTTFTEKVTTQTTREPRNIFILGVSIVFKSGRVKIFPKTAREANGKLSPSRPPLGSDHGQNYQSVDTVCTTLLATLLLNFGLKRLTLLFPHFHLLKKNPPV